jgi:hypothetical protein
MKTQLPKWLFAVTLAGTVICSFSPSGDVASVTTALAPEREMPLLVKVSSENVAEDLDDRVAHHARTLAGWRALLETQADVPHAPAAQTDAERLLPTPQPVDVAEQSQRPVSETQTLVNPESPTTVEKEPTPPATPTAAPVALAEDAPLPPSRPREIALAKSVEPAHNGQRRAEHHRASQPNVFVALLATGRAALDFFR